MNRLISKTSLLATLLVAAVIIPFLVFGDKQELWVQQCVASGQSHSVMTGILLAAMLAVDIVLPIPSSLVSAGCGYLLGPFWGTVTSSMGMTVGCAVGYVLGCGLGPVTRARLFSDSEFQRLERWHSRTGIWMLALCRPIPVLAETSTVFAGLLRFGWIRFVAITTTSNVLISLIYALLGSLGSG